ncbi:MAG: ATP-dependent DNA ligase [Actinomycetota bacterium]|nr:ATP-dependent DNA ligase [Actinomycetota bacterium]
MSGPTVVSVGGHRLTLTSLNKVLYPATGTTKADVLGYYAEIADLLIAHSRWRPATRKRWVDGVGTAEHPGKVFFEKTLPASAPAWVKRFSVAHSDHDNEYPVINDAATLAWLGQVAALEIHVPQWQFGPRGRRKNPDRLVLDLDPGEGSGLQECVEVARSARAMLQGIGLEPFPVTSGSKGVHLYARLPGDRTSDEISAVAHDIARQLESQHPDLVVSGMSKALRRGKVLVDWSQNSGAKTTVTPYSLRGRELPTVAAPRTWRELASASLRQLTYDEVLDRVRRRGDPLASLAEPVTTETSGDQRSTYRSMRNRAKTPEPVPARTGRRRGQTFVIQEQHARRLHVDFRLEHKGVLVSWVLPKGVPTDPGTNHLAVRTEDHAIEHANFDGTIPHDQHGGEVEIWDHGTFELEKWIDGKEVIATLHGSPDGGMGGRPHTFALIHTESKDRQEENWLIHLMSKTSNRLPIEAMLATAGRPGDVLEPGWSLEMKWDGVRAICEITENEARLWSRTGNELTATFPELAGALREAISARDAVIDGEIVAFGPGGGPSFGTLQSRLGLSSAAAIQSAAKRVPVHLMIFDLLRLNGHEAIRLPYSERRGMLTSVLVEGALVHVPSAFEGDVDAAIGSSAEHGLEGIVAKRSDGPYRPGKRSSDWIKLKHVRTQEVVVVGWQEGSGRRSGGVGSLLLAVNDGDSLRYVGKVGTGFSDRDLDAMLVKFARLTRKTEPAADVPATVAREAHWLKPSLVGEVQFTEWTHTRRLRHPTWRGWRSDKTPADVRAE